MEISSRNIKYFDKATEIAMGSEFDRYHLGCVAVLKNKIISVGINKLKTHTVQAEYDKYRHFNCRSDMKNMHSLHAEIDCITSIKQNINYKDLELYIVRLKKDGSYGLARPCAACMPFIISKGIRKIFYTTNYGFAFEFV